MSPPPGPSGVGVSYLPALEPLLRTGLADWVEVEPQTLWLNGPEGCRWDRPALERLLALPQPKLVHGVGFPVGGSRPPDPAHLPLLLDAARQLRPPWVSEHLSFNEAAGPNGAFGTGFLLPPAQTAEGVAAAAASIRSVAAALPVPLLVETGVNYLRPQPWELPDGAFVGQVAEAAGCGILLDLHNAWCNERNGRQPVEEFVAQLPTERVWELHVAGGHEEDGYWVDAHSGPVAPEVLGLLRRLLPRLPHVRAVVYEVFPSFLPAVGLAGVRRQLAELRAIWDETRAAPPTPPPTWDASRRPAGPPPTPQAWEDALGAAILGRPATTPLGHALDSDPGLPVYRRLLGTFRASMAMGALPLTLRYLLLSRGAAATDQLLAGFWARTPPARFASDEAAAFADHLLATTDDTDCLRDVAAFERAALATLLDGETRVVPFTRDPVMVLRPLADGRLPQDPKRGSFEVEVTPPGVGEARAAVQLPTA